MAEEQDHSESAAGQSAADLRRENEELKDRLRKYKDLEEELAAQKVFERAKQKLTVWLTLGGLVTVLAGIVGFSQIENYTQELVKKKVDTITEQQLNALIDHHVENNVAARDAYIKAQISDAIGRYVASKPLTLSPSSAPEEGGQALVFDPAKGLVDYSSEMVPIRDQGSEGSSVGFAVADALAYQIYKKTGKQALISARYIYYLARKSAGTASTDSGAFIKDAITPLARYGAVAEQVWPYKGGEFAAEPPKEVEQAEKYRAGSVQKLKSLDDMKAALQKYGPVVAGIALYNGVFSEEAAKTGNISDPSPNDLPVGGQAVCIVGYNDQKKMIKFRNSWGPKWGDKGYGYISYNYFQKFSDDNWAVIDTK
jgi:C1A family cysteine protease